MGSIGKFIRGSQLLDHDTAMFAVGFKWPLLLITTLFLGMLWWALETGQSEHDAYLVWMRIYAAGYMFMEFPAAKLVNIEDPLGGGHLVPISILEYYPPVAIAWAQFKTLLWSSVAWTAGIGTVGTLLYVGISYYYGALAGKIRHVRGAKMVTADVLDRIVKQHNIAPHLHRLKAQFGIWYRALSLEERLEHLKIRAYSIAGVDYPLGTETVHTLVIGSTGSGKTQTLLDLVEQVRTRGGKAVIFDVKGDYVSTFYDPKRDIILNPSDQRCPAWNIFDECRTLSEFSVAAEALIPTEGSPEEGFWISGARTLFVNYCMEMQARGTPTNADLAKRLMTASLEEIYAIVKDTPAGVLMDPKTDRMANSVRAVFNTNARSLLMLPSEGHPLSIRDWVKRDAQDGSILFLSIQFVDLKICKQLLTLWIDTVLITMMSGEGARDTRLWTFIDEIGALHRLPSLKSALESARSYGGAIVLGCHSISQIRETYGRDAEQTITGLLRTKFFLSMADKESAEYASELIGIEEVIDVQEGATIGLNSTRDARSLSYSRTQRALRLPQEIRDTKSLSGYLKFPEGLPVAPVMITPVKREKVAPGFLARPILPARHLLPEVAEDVEKRRDDPAPVEASPVSSVKSDETGAVNPADSASSGTHDTDDDGEGGQQKQGQRIKIGLTAGPEAKAGRRKEKGAAKPGSAERRHGELPLEEPTKGGGAGQAGRGSGTSFMTTAGQSLEDKAIGPGKEGGGGAVSGVEPPDGTAGALSQGEQGTRHDITASAATAPGKVKPVPTKARDPDELDFDR